MVRRALSKISCALLATTLSLQSYALSIEQAWQQAKQSDPNYEKAKIAVQLGEVGVDISQSSLLPGAEVTASTQWDQSTSSPHNTNSYSASLSQTIWDSSLWSGLDRAQANRLKYQLELSQAYNQLAQQLLSAYFYAASAQGDLQLAQSQLEEGAKLLNVIEKRYKAGKTRSIDVEEIKANQISEKAAIFTAQANLQEKRAELAALINHMPEQVDQVNTDSLGQPSMLVGSQEQWFKLAKDSSPEFLVAIQNVKVSEFAKDSAQAGYYPKVTGSVGYGDDDRHSNGEFNAGITLNVPLDFNGATRAKVDEASLNILGAKQDLRRVEIDIQKRIIQQFAQVENNWSQVLTAAELVESRVKVLRSKKTLYGAGLLDVQEVIRSHNSLFEAKHTLQTHLYDYWLAAESWSVANRRKARR